MRGGGGEGVRGRGEEGARGVKTGLLSRAVTYKRSLRVPCFIEPFMYWMDRVM